ncbi:MAG: 3-phosphoshikimate 1-carboxyvinyltransferase [Pseudomonadota bacterium]
MSNYHIKASQLSGSIAIPASKSQSIRAILFATMAKGVSTVENYLNSPDIKAMVSACRQLGAEIEQQDNKLLITGVDGNPNTPDDVIDSGNSGQVLRFVACLAGLQDHYVVLTGDASIRHNRPVQPLLEALPKLGVQCESLRGDGYAPLIIKGPFQGSETTLSGEDSQPVSGLLMALAFKQGVSTITVRNPGEKPWVNLTLKWFDRFGISYKNDNFANYQVTGKARISAFNYRVPGDLSSLAYPLLAALVTHSEITITDVDMNEPQGDKAIVEVFRKMGAKISMNEQERTLTVHKIDFLQGIEVDVNNFIDCVTIIAVAGCFAQGTTKITGAEIARTKESDRISAITRELKKMGANIEELPDGLIVQQSQLHAANVDSYHDHRIVMSLAVAALTIKEETIIHDVRCVQKSFPNFDGIFQSLGGNIVSEA